ncbi:MAG: aminopeptidase [Clostridiales bacterium]|nr:aminopeptidase [Clostridiales bacterium]
MQDPRISKLAQTLIRYSVALQPDEKILIEATSDCGDLVRALVGETYRAGGLPFVWLRDKAVDRALLLQGTPEQFQSMAEWDAAAMSAMQAYIGIRGGANAAETADVPAARQNDYMTHYWNPVHSAIRVKATRWCVLRYPTPSMAQLAGQSTEGFEDYYFNVCGLDYAKMERAMAPLQALMERTDQVHILGPCETDLRFSIRGMPAIPCSGHRNIPDGEVYTAPVRDSVSGVIAYNTPALRDGFTYENVRLVFQNGRIIEATANDTDRLNAQLDIDEGARYIGEFALGVNPHITTPMKDTLFDEKIAGSLHFTPGASYDHCSNGNHSALHWDLVLIQTPTHGGGEIYFDDVLIRKDGRFTLPELIGLNPENLR